MHCAEIMVVMVVLARNSPRIRGEVCSGVDLLELAPLACSSLLGPPIHCPSHVRACRPPIQCCASIPMAMLMLPTNGRVVRRGLIYNSKEQGGGSQQQHSRTESPCNRCLVRVPTLSPCPCYWMSPLPLLLDEPSPLPLVDGETLPPCYWMKTLSPSSYWMKLFPPAAG